MYARATTSRKQPGQLDEYLRLYREEALPAFKAHDGFVRALVLVDREANEATSILVFTEAAALSEAQKDPRITRLVI